MRVISLTSHYLSMRFELQYSVPCLNPLLVRFLVHIKPLYIRIMILLFNLKHSLIFRVSNILFYKIITEI